MQDTYSITHSIIHNFSLSLSLSLQIINTGVKVFCRCDHPQTSCNFRLCQEVQYSHYHITSACLYNTRTRTCTYVLGEIGGVVSQLYPAPGYRHHAAPHHKTARWCQYGGPGALAEHLQPSDIITITSGTDHHWTIVIAHVAFFLHHSSLSLSLVIGPSLLVYTPPSDHTLSSRYTHSTTLHSNDTHTHVHIYMHTHKGYKY